MRSLPSRRDWPALESEVETVYARWEALEAVRGG